MTIKELYNRELNSWVKSNILLFGVSPIHEMDEFSTILAKLQKDCEDYWNSDSPCLLAERLCELDKDIDKRIPNSYILDLNELSMCIDVYASYNTKKGVEALKVCSFPTPTDELTWIINKAHYVPRIMASKDKYGITKLSDTGHVSFDGFLFNGECVIKRSTGELVDVQTALESISLKTKEVLLSSLDKETRLTKDNFIEALQKVPEFESSSIYKYKFTRLEPFFDLLKRTRKFAMPISGNVLGVNALFLGMCIDKKLNDKVYYAQGNLVFVEKGNLALNLEQSRTVINVYHGEYKPAFTYRDSVGFFDSFRTPTSKEAGRQRILTDDVEVRDGMLWIDNKSMFYYRNNYPSVRLSCLSESPFCRNDKPKRIMMNAKMTTQSITLNDELDNITHRIKVRVGFADIKGYSYADSIIISESLAKRLRTYQKDIVYVDDSFVIHKLETEENFNQFSLLYPEQHPAILDSFENIKIDRIEYINNSARVFLSWEVPFRKGDKITNLHGAKGTVGLILPDEKMPFLKSKVGTMDSGALEMIVSGFSTIRRESLGQIFEAWASASGLDIPHTALISDCIYKYAENMYNYANSTEVSFRGETICMPVGYNLVMRLHHHASTHISTASVYDKKRTLRLGEMEKLHLVSSGCFSTLKELALRSGHKYLKSKMYSVDMERGREFPLQIKNQTLKFTTLTKMLGYEAVLKNNTFRIKRHEPLVNRENEVTSHKVFRGKAIKDRNGKFVFNEEGILSPRIFGEYRSCTCGRQCNKGICSHCGCRVLSNKEPMPDFYISFEDIINIPYLDIDDELALKILRYEYILYEGEVIEFNLDKLNLSDLDPKKVLYGENALINLGYSREWIAENVRRRISIPHTSYRRMIINSTGGYFLGDLNLALIDILKAKHRLCKYLEEKDIFSIIALSKRLISHIVSFENTIFNILCRQNKSVLDRELRGQEITGAIRGVITNRYDLDEDVVLIGKYFLDTLYPDLAKRGLSVQEVNEYLTKEKYLILVNRQPTIGQKSIVAMKPVFSDEDTEKYIIQLNPIIFDGLAGDVDGDVLFLIALYTKEACNEVIKLLPSNNYLEASSYGIRNGLPPEFLYVYTQLKNEGYFTNIDDLTELSREDFIKVYRIVGEYMFSKCVAPTVKDFVMAYNGDDSNIINLTAFAGNTESIIASIKKKDISYTDEESNTFMKSVISANITDIVESGYFFKKLVSSADLMRIDDIEDCGAEGEEVTLPITEPTFNFMIRGRYVQELGKYINSFSEFEQSTVNLTSVHIRTFLNCKHDPNHRRFCKRCAGEYHHSHDTSFLPKYIGLYATQMITEHATQASLDSMNNGCSVKVNTALEQKLSPCVKYETVVNNIQEIIKEIGGVGVESRFYEVALLSRLTKDKKGRWAFSALVTSFLKQEDKLGAFIYRPSWKTFLDMVGEETPCTSVKSMIALDNYNEMGVDNR